MGLLKVDALSIAAAQLAPCIACIFNACQRVAALPRSWALCGITPIHKGGDTQDPGNYRGIAVGSLLAKLYACILNELLIKWTEQHQLRGRGQAGFRRDHRTTDQTFVVRTLIEKAKTDRQPLYSCFVNFKKAYDTVFVLEHCLGQDALCKKQTNKQTNNMTLYLGICFGRSCSALGCMGRF